MTIDEILKSGNYALVDVREPMELMMDGEIEGANNIPMGELESRKDEVLNLGKPVVVFCRSGNRSAKALEYLTQQGLKDGYNGGGFGDLQSKL